MELGSQAPHHGAAYTAKVRVSVRAGDITIVREGSDTGESKAPTPGQAHELALKSAETDATKRALATFGNPFGLALYDREQIGVRKARSEKASPPIGPSILRSASRADEASFEKPSEFTGALRKAMSDAQRHRASVRHLGAECRHRASLEQEPEARAALAELSENHASARQSFEALRNRARRNRKAERTGLAIAKCWYQRRHPCMLR